MPEPARVASLSPYLPRLVLRWLDREPDRTARELYGSMAFVDISGFTKMSERLARRGKVGAEEVTDVLGSAFIAAASSSSSSATPIASSSLPDRAPARRC